MLRRLPEKLLPDRIDKQIKHKTKISAENAEGKRRVRGDGNQKKQ